jgi:hypothetical protein
MAEAFFFGPTLLRWLMPHGMTPSKSESSVLSLVVNVLPDNSIR